MDSQTYRTSFPGPSNVQRSSGTRVVMRRVEPENKKKIELDFRSREFSLPISGENHVEISVSVKDRGPFDENRKSEQIFAKRSKRNLVTLSNLQRRYDPFLRWQK